MQNNHRKIDENSGGNIINKRAKSEAIQKQYKNQ